MAFATGVQQAFVCSMKEAEVSAVVFIQSLRRLFGTVGEAKEEGRTSSDGRHFSLLPWRLTVTDTVW